MNSSGIKRGLATTAVSALAVAGIPFIASSAHAENGDVLTVAYVGPARDGGDLGATIVFETKGLTEAEVNNALGDPNNSQLKVKAQDLTNDASNALQTIGDVDFVSFVADSSASSKFGRNDGFDEVTVQIPVDTRTTGDTAKFAVYVDDDGMNDVDASEAAVNVQVQTSGAPDSLMADPTYQASAPNTPTGDYTVVLKDDAGRTTQLTGAEVIEFDQLSGPAGGAATFAPTGPLDLNDVGPDGEFAFTAQGNVNGLYRLQAGAFSAAGAASPFASTIVNLDVSGTVATPGSISAQELNLVTGADDRAGFNKPSNSAQVRPDQAAVTFEIDDMDPAATSQAGKIVQLTATGTGVTFGGKSSQAQSVTLDKDGKGSVTFTVDASTIASGDSFQVTGTALANPFTVNYAAPAVGANTTDADQDTYISAFGGTVTPVLTVKDQSGNPVPGVYVTYQLQGGANAGSESARVITDEAGKASFSIKDTKASATNRASDTILFTVYDGRLSGNVLDTDNGSVIAYTADGQGADFLLTVDGQTPGGAAYDPTVVPLTDAIANDNDEKGTLRIVGGTSGAEATVTVDGGALILDGNTELDDAVSSLTGSVGDTFEIIGTTEGEVNITVTSGGKTQEATLTVEAAEDNSAEARNVELEGPENAVAGDVVDFTATVTDAFGNPVSGFDGDDFDVRITGPGNEQGNSGDSDENGEITFSVEITQGASNPVTLRIDADDVSQFGAKANELDATTTPTVAAPGLTESNDVASATVNVVDIEELEQAVADAEAALAEAQADLAEAQADLDVAQAKLAIAQSEVDRLQERKQNLREKLNKAKAKGNKQKAKTTRKKIRKVKSQLRDARQAVVIAQADVDGEQTVVDLREDQVEAAEEALAQAQADLDEAQN